MLALVARVHEAVLALIVQLHQHAHGAPLAPPEGAELPMLVPCERQEGVAAVHQITGEQRVRVNDGRQGVGHGSRVQVDDEEHLQQIPQVLLSFILKHCFQAIWSTALWADLFVLLHRGVELLGQIVGYVRHPRLLFIGSAHAALVFIGLLVVLLLSVLAITLRPLQEAENLVVTENSSEQDRITVVPK